MMAVTKCRDVSREFIQAQQCMGDNCSLCSLPGSQQTVYCRQPVDMIEPRESVILVLMIFIMRILMIWIFIVIVMVVAKLDLIIFYCRHLYFLIKY